jgi:hypothetical protein
MHNFSDNAQMVHLGTLTLSGTTPAASAWVDAQGYNDTTLVVVTRTVTDAGTAAGFTLTGQYSDTTAAADAADLTVDLMKGGAAVSLAVTSDSADDAIVGYLKPDALAQYFRVRAVGTTGTNAVVDVFAVQINAAQRPTTFVGTAVAAT